MENYPIAITVDKEVHHFEVGEMVMNFYREIARLKGKNKRIHRNYLRN